MFCKAGPEDVRRVYELICGMEQRELPYVEFERIFMEQLEDRNYYCMVCRLEGETIAVLNLRFEKQLHHAGRLGEIMEFAVDERHRARGLGGEMFRCACALAGERGCIQLEVACNRLRRDTHRFYLREGMQNFHYKFSLPLTGEAGTENRLGR